MRMKPIAWTVLTACVAVLVLTGLVWQEPDRSLPESQGHYPKEQPADKSAVTVSAPDSVPEESEPFAGEVDLLGRLEIPGDRILDRIGLHEKRLADIRSREPEARLFVDTYLKQFDGVDSLQLSATTTQLVDTDEIRAGTVLKSVFHIGLRPFRVHEVTEGEGYRCERITSEKSQIETKTIRGVLSTTRKTNMMPDPLVHGSLPWLEPFFQFQEYGAGLERPVTELKKDVDLVHVDSLVGKLVFYHRELPSTGRLVAIPRELVSWKVGEHQPFHFQKMTEPRLMDGYDFVYLKNVTHYTRDNEEKPVRFSEITFDEVKCNVKLDESLFTLD